MPIEIVMKAGAAIILMTGIITLIHVAVYRL